MGIGIQWLLENVAKKRLSGSGPRFDAVFVEAVNQVISDLNTQCDLSVGLIGDDGIGANVQIDLDQAIYSRAFVHGVPYYMQLFAEWAKDPPDFAKFAYDRALALCQFHNTSELPAGIPEGDWSG